MTRFARGFKKKHLEATSWDDLKSSSDKRKNSTTVKEKINERPFEESPKALSRLEKNREARRKRRSMKKICFRCRKPGHAVTNCPSLNDTESPVDICFKCGSTEHMIQKCKAKIAKDSFPFAKCFVCGQDGHISRKCPDNPRGLYPLGGGCKFCDSVEHFKRDCPENPNNKRNETSQPKVILQRSNNFSSADAETFSDEEKTDAVPATVKKKKPTVVKF